MAEVEVGAEEGEVVAEVEVAVQEPLEVAAVMVATVVWLRVTAMDLRVPSRSGQAAAQQSLRLAASIAPTPQPDDSPPRHLEALIRAVE